MIIFDIDGVLADHRHRIGVSDKGEYDRLMSEDPVIEAGSALFRQFNSLDLVLLTGRLESRRKITEAWLKKHELYDGYLFLHMRKTLDQDEVEFKRVACEILGLHNIHFAIDDKLSNIDMYRSLNIPSLHAKFLEGAVDNSQKG